MTLPIALDTNLLVRLLSGDDPELARRVADLIDASPACFVPITVVLELEWVLRGASRLERGAVIAAVGWSDGNPPSAFRAGGSGAAGAGLAPIGGSTSPLPCICCAVRVAPTSPPQSPHPCSRRRAAATSSSAGQNPSPRADPCSGKGSRSPRDPACRPAASMRPPTALCDPVHRPGA
jgi:hypothetical protein